MGLPRPSDPFHRVYSPPEPPATARRSTLVGAVMVVLAFSLVGFAVFVLASDRNPEGAPRPAAASPSVLRTQPFTTLPPPCGTVLPSTVKRLVPKAATERSANTTLTTCTFTMAGTGSPWLRVETRIFVPVDGTSPIEAATDHFAEQWTRARTDPVVRPVSLRRHAGLGDEAYRRYTIDRSRPVAVGQVVVRLRNAVITVSYGENARGVGGEAANEREFLAAATEVAQEVTGAFK